MVNMRKVIEALLKKVLRGKVKNYCLRSTVNREICKRDRCRYIWRKHSNCGKYMQK